MWDVHILNLLCSWETLPINHSVLSFRTQCCTRQPGKSVKRCSKILLDKVLSRRLPLTYGESLAILGSGAHVRGGQTLMSAILLSNFYLFETISLTEPGCSSVIKACHHSCLAFTRMLGMERRSLCSAKTLPMSHLSNPWIQLPLMLYV